MAEGKRMTVGVALTPDIGFLPALRALVRRVAGQVGFGESQQGNLEQGVGQACQRLMEARPGSGQEMHLQVGAFSDRVEVVVEDGGDASVMSEADTLLLNQLLDRVVVEETREGKLRLTLVMYLTGVESQS